MRSASLDAILTQLRSQGRSIDSHDLDRGRPLAAAFLEKTPKDRRFRELKELFVKRRIRPGSFSKRAPNPCGEISLDLTVIRCGRGFATRRDPRKMLGPDRLPTRDGGRVRCRCGAHARFPFTAGAGMIKGGHSAFTARFSVAAPLLEGKSLHASRQIIDVLRGSLAGFPFRPHGGDDILPGLFLAKGMAQPKPRSVEHASREKDVHQAAIVLGPVPEARGYRHEVGPVHRRRRLIMFASGWKQPGAETDLGRFGRTPGFLTNSLLKSSVS